MNIKQLFGILAIVLIGSLMVVACSSTVQATSEAEAEHDDGDEHADDGDDMDMDMADEHSPEAHMGEQHDVPEEAAAVPNPIEANGESVAAGAALYASNCAICHAEAGEGDGPAAAGMTPQPADLNAGHVQGLSDGALFYIISHGKPDTPMPAWEDVLAEDERWQVVNFLRTFGD